MRGLLLVLLILSPGARADSYFDEPPPEPAGCTTLAIGLGVDLGASLAVLVLANQAGQVIDSGGTGATLSFAAGGLLAPVFALPLLHWAAGDRAAPFEGLWPALGLRAAVLVPAVALSLATQDRGPIATGTAVSLVAGAVVDALLVTLRSPGEGEAPRDRNTEIGLTLGFATMPIGPQDPGRGVDVSAWVGRRTGPHLVALGTRVTNIGATLFGSRPFGGWVADVGGLWRWRLTDGGAAEPFLGLGAGLGASTGCRGDVCDGVGLSGAAEAGIAVPVTDAAVLFTLALHGLVGPGVSPPPIVAMSIGYTTH